MVVFLNWSGECVIVDDLLLVFVLLVNVGCDVLICLFGLNVVWDYLDESWCKIVEGLWVVGWWVVFNGVEGDCVWFYVLVKKCGNVSVDVMKDFLVFFDLMM